MTRAEIDTALWALVSRAQGLVSEALAATEEESWWEDHAAHATVRANAVSLQNRVLELNTQVARIVSMRDEDLRQSDVDKVQGYSGLIADEASYIVAIEQAEGFRGFVAQVVSDFAAFVAQVASAAATVTTDIAAGVVGGVLDGLGPVGVLVVVGLVWLVLRNRGA